MNLNWNAQQCGLFRGVEIGRRINLTGAEIGHRKW